MGEKPVPFTDMEMRTILDGALHHLYQAELVKIDWNIFLEAYETTLSKLEGMEVDILQKFSVHLQLGLINGGGPKGGKPNNKRKGQPLEGQHTKKPKCKMCGKFHKGECQFAKKPIKQEFKSQLISVLHEPGKTDGYSTDTSWKKGTTADERVFVASTVAAELSDSDASIASDRARKLLKTYQKTKKKIKGKKLKGL